MRGESSSGFKMGKEMIHTEAQVSYKRAGSGSRAPNRHGNRPGTWEWNHCTIVQGTEQIYERVR